MIDSGSVILHIGKEHSKTAGRFTEWGYEYHSISFEQLEHFPYDSLLLLIDDDTITLDRIEILKDFFVRTSFTTIVMLTPVTDQELRGRLELLTQIVWIESEMGGPWLDRLHEHCKRLEASKHYQNVLKTRSRRSGLFDAIGAVAHQWRQPINLISMDAISLSLQSKMSPCVASEDVRISADFIVEQTQRMSKILTNILTMGKEQRHKGVFTPHPLLEAVKQFFLLQFEQNGIKLSVEFHGTSFDIFGFQSDLEEVIINLVANARDAYKDNSHNNESKTIRINVIDEDNVICIDVIDYAGGVPLEIRDRIFERDFSTKKEGDGFGIGLHIARLIIENEFGGTLTLYAQEHGSRFRITLPKHNAIQNKLIY